MARNLTTGLQRGLRRSVAGGLGAGDLFSTAALDLRFAQQKTLDPRITFTRASSGTYVDSQGVIRTATTNEPRFDHNPTTGESLGLLVEESRTNLLLRSEEFDNAAWTQTALQAFGSGSVANAIASPSGSITADLITENTANSEHNALQAVTVTANTVYTLSCFAKKGTRSVLAMSPTAPGVANYYTLFNLDTGAIVFNETGNTSTITALGNGWYRCSITRTTGAAQVAINNKIGIANNLLSTTYTGDGTSGIYLWGAQLEAGSFPTSYIPTTTSAVTRSADVASITGTNFSSWYRQDEGTLFADAAGVSNLGGATRRYCEIRDNASSERVILGYSALINNRFLVVDNSSTVADITATSSPTAKAAGAYKVNSFQLATNGTLSTEDGVGTVPTPDQMFIGSQDGSSANTFLNGTIRRLTYWPQRLPNATLQQITR